ncbi:MAG: hypothetical protein OEY49_00935 [Candidatus Heimdallarchaeota archaeon]|nr:hypothetical protein [Candidatus Heimdallarchaeota archaeon]
MTRNLAEFSDFDGDPSNEYFCAFCKLNAGEKFIGSNNLCKVCKNQSIIAGIIKASQKLFLTALFLGFLALMNSTYFGFLLIPSFIVLFIPTLLSTGLGLKIQYYGIPENNRIVSLLRYYKLTDLSIYYSDALKFSNKYGETFNEILVGKITNELVNSVLLSSIPVPQNVIQEWATSFQLHPEELVEQIIRNTEILSSFSPNKGIGLLPSIYNFILSEDSLIIAYDTILKHCNNLEDYSSFERTTFLEDLYLIETELKEFTSIHPSYEKILQTLKSFEPETPPKNFMEQVKLQAEYNQRQMMQK